MATQMNQAEAVRRVQDAITEFYERLEAEGVPYAATIADAATAAAIEAQSKCGEDAS